LLWACGSSEPPPPRENVLQLVLGGENKSLGAALRALQPERAEPRVEPEPVPEPAPAREPPPRSREEPIPQPTPVVPPREVRLGRGQTVAALAREHLGSGDRWREILDLNGWTEADAKRLSVGTVVRLPTR
jgi:hypothetical protein